MLMLEIQQIKTLSNYFHNVETSESETSTHACHKEPQINFV